MRDVRLRDGMFEGKCEVCKDWWPMTLEFWPGREAQGLRKCKACVAEYQRLRRRQERVDRRDEINAARRARCALAPIEVKLAKHAAAKRYYEAHRDDIGRQRRERYQANIESERANALARYHYGKQHPRREGRAA